MVAHRGAAAEAPENTTAAFELAVELGADALELDVRLAADGALAVIHDETLDRTTGATGPVRARTGPELEAAGVPLLETVLRAHPGLRVTVDVKDPGAAPSVVELAEALGRAGRTVLYVEDGTRLASFRAYPGPRATSTRQAMRFAVLDRWLPGLPRPSFPEVIHTPLRRFGLPVLSPGFVEAAHRHRREVQVWTVNEPRWLRRLADWGVEAIVTDDVRTAVSVLGPSGPG